MYRLRTTYKRCRIHVLKHTRDQIIEYLYERELPQSLLSELEHIKEDNRT